MVILQHDSGLSFLLDCFPPTFEVGKCFLADSSESLRSCLRILTF